MGILKHKWVLYNFSPYEYKGLETYLEQMALKGWKLKHIKYGFLCFERIEAKAIKYTVDFIDSIISIDGENSDVSLEYREYCEMAGWEFICESGKLQIYSTQEEVKSIPIHTDEEEKFKNIAKVSFKNAGREMFLILIFIFNLYNIFGGNRDARFLAQNMSLMTGLLTIIFIIMGVIENINLVVWYIKNKINIKKNKEILYNNYKMIKFKVGFYIFMIVLCMVIAGYFIFFEKNILLTKMMFLIILEITVLKFLVKYINKKKLETKQKRKFKIMGFIGIFIGVVMLMNVVIFSSLMSRNIVRTNEKIKQYPMTISDFGYNNSKYENIYEYEDKSPIAYNLTYADNSDENTLMYDFFESKYKWAVEYDLYRILKMEKSYGISFEHIETLGGDVKVYESDNKANYIFYVLLIVHQLKA